MTIVSLVNRGGLENRAADLSTRVKQMLTEYQPHINYLEDLTRVNDLGIRDNP
jgi:hypothetical protein